MVPLRTENIPVGMHKSTNSGSQSRPVQFTNVNIGSRKVRVAPDTSGPEASNLILLPRMPLRQGFSLLTAK